MDAKYNKINGVTLRSHAECVVSGPLAVILRVSRFVGTSPLRFHKTRRGWLASLSSSYSLYGYFTITIVSLIIAGIIINLLQEPEKDRIVWAVGAVMATTLAATIVYGAPGRMRCLITTLNQVEKINSELKVHTDSSPWTGKQFAIWIFWGAVSMSLIMTDEAMLRSTSIQIYGQTWFYVITFVHIINFWVVQLGQMQFVLVALYVRSSFKSINKYLRSLLLENTMNVGFLQGNIRSVSSAYVAACDAVRDVSSSYGPMLMMSLGTIFLLLITTPYYFITRLLFNISTDQMINISYELVQIFWCIYQSATLLMIVEPCHLTHMEIKRTRELVGRLLQRAHSMSDPLVVELEQFCSLLALNDVSYRPLHMTTMTRGLVLKIFGSIATYLVVLIDID